MDILIKCTRWVHRRIYLFTALFSRAGIDKFLAENIDEFNRNRADYKSILNIGSGGRVANSLDRIRYAEIVNIDIDPLRQPDIVVDVCAMDNFKDAFFDVVIMVEVLEHVHSPADAISEICRVLRRGGTLLLTVPFIFEIHDQPNDYYRFTKYGLERVLSEFSAVSIRPRNGYLESVVVLVMRLFVSPHFTDKLIATVLVGILLILYPGIWLLEKCIRTDAATSGYLVKCTK